MTSFEYLIKNGTVYDGSNSIPSICDIGISDGLIKAVGKLTGHSAKAIIDADGLVVAPGFIDTHSHSDFTILADPRAEGKSFQGITTEIVGNCGLSAAPLLGKSAEKREPMLRDLGISERWQSFNEYFSLLEKRNPSINIASLVGHGNLRGSVVGYEDTSLSPAHNLAIKSLLMKSLSEGGIGLSSGLVYPPGIFSDSEEIIALCKVLLDYSPDTVYTTHMRSEGDYLIESIQESIEVARKTGVHVHISHLKTASESNWWKIKKVLAEIEKAEADGLRISFDRYPYTSSSTDLDYILPQWVFDGGDSAEIERLKTPLVRKRIKDYFLKQNIASEQLWMKISIASVSSQDNKWMEGKSISEIANTTGEEEPIEVIFNLLIEESLRVTAIFHIMSEENLKMILSHERCCIGTDSSARSYDGVTKVGLPHPRSFGCFPRFFGYYVRDLKLLSLEEAIFRTTYLPATMFNIKGRGLIAPGMFADIVIFDFEKISDNSTFHKPFVKPSGIIHVFVNGIPILYETNVTGHRSGKVLRSLAGP